MQIIRSSAVAVISGLSLSAVQAGDYTFTNFDAPGSEAYTYTASINDAGQVAGYFEYNGGGANKLGFYGKVGSLVTIANVTVPNQGTSRWTDAMGINNDGLVAGNYGAGLGDVFIGLFLDTKTNTYRYWDPIDPDLDMIVMGVNSLGTVVGYYEGTLGTHGFLYDGVSTFTAIDNPAADTAGPRGGTHATGVNTQGHVVGYFHNSTGYHGFFYNGSTYSTLDAPGAIPGGTVAFGINDKDQIVGYYFDANLISHGYLYSAGHYQTGIDDPAATRGTELRAINNKGQLAGSYYDACCFRGFTAVANHGDWPMYGYEPKRGGYNPSEALLDPGTVGALSVGWSFSAPSTASAQPIVAAGINIAGTPTDLVYLTTDEGTLYGLNATTGAVLWQRNLGSVATSCPNTTGPRAGISNAPLFDRAHQLLLVVGGDGVLYGLDAATGAIAVSAPVTSDPRNEQVYGSVAMRNGYIYATVGSACGQAPGHGKVVAFAISTRGEATRLYPATDGLANFGGGSITGAGGPALDPTTGDLFVGTGSAYPDISAGAALYTDALLRLGGQSTNLLQVQAAFKPEPSTDFGASSVVLFQPQGCPTKAAALGKNGLLSVFDKDALAAGPAQSFQIANFGSVNNGGHAAFDPSANKLYVVSATDPDLVADPANPFRHGLIAFDVQGDCSLKLAWQAGTGVNDTPIASPVSANGVVYYAAANSVYAVNGSSGAILGQWSDPFTAPVAAPPTIINGQLYVLTRDGKLTMLR